MLKLTEENANLVVTEAIFCFSYVIFHHVSWKITCKYQAYIASINRYEGITLQKLYRETSTHFLITHSYLTYLQHEGCVSPILVHSFRHLS